MELSSHSDVGTQLADRRIQVSVVMISSKRTHKRSVVEADRPNTSKSLIALSLRLGPRVYANVDHACLLLVRAATEIRHDQSDLCILPRDMVVLRVKPRPRSVVPEVKLMTAFVLWRRRIEQTAGLRRRVSRVQQAAAPERKLRA